MVSSQAQQQLYTHAAEPKAVQQRKAKYRDEEPSFPSVSNIMYDRRVVRGNTYAARILPADATLAATTDLKKTTSGTTKRRSARQAPPRTPDAVEGRRHIDIQTDVYLEELTDTVPEADNGTQTDAFLDRPPTPLFVPQKTGIDATTQIENGDLFDFDFEVEPILEVLVGKVLEQGLMEVLEEEELAAMQSHQEHFEQIRNAELVATQRMEAAEMRRLEEKERRLAQERDRLEREKVVRQKVAATTFARGYLSGIVNSVFDQLQASGYFYDPVLREVEVQFMPWLQEQAVGYLAQGVAARKVVQQLVADAAAQLQRNRDDAAARQHARIVAAEEAAVRERLAAEAADGEVLTAIQNMATFVLLELKPPVTTPEAVEAARAELVVAAEAASLAKWEEAKAVAGETARADAEAKLEAQRAQLEEMAAKAAEDAAEAGEEPPPPPTELPDGEALVDVEAVVAAAIAAVQQEPVKEVTDNDVLSHMLEKGVITKDSIVHSMAVDSLGDEAYTRHPLFAEPVAPA